jgi:hypothetical protein
MPENALRPLAYGTDPKSAPALPPCTAPNCKAIRSQGRSPLGTDRSQFSHTRHAGHDAEETERRIH